MTLSNDTPIAIEFLARTIIRLRVRTHQRERRCLPRQYRRMSDHGLADIGFCRTRIDFLVLGDDHRR